MACGWNCAALPQQPQRYGAVVSSSPMSQRIRFAELRSRAYIATCMGAIVIFSMRDSFGDGRVVRIFDAALILRWTFRDHIFLPASVIDERS